MPEERSSLTESSSLLGRFDPITRRHLMVGAGAVLGLAFLETMQLSCDARLPDVPETPSDQPPDYMPEAEPGN